MKTLRYDTYLAANQIFSPFDFSHEHISLYNDLLTSLPKLFPIKSTFYLQKNPGSLSVALLPDAPYGPAIDTLINSLFSDFEKALFEVKDFFGLGKIGVISPQRPSQDRAITWSKHIRKRHTAGIVLSVFEFYRLYMAATKQQHIKSVLVSIFVDPHTIFCFHVPEGMPLKHLLLHLHTEHALQQSTGGKLFHPILRREIDPEKETTGEHTALMMFTHSGYTIGPDDNVLLKFPYFRRKIAIRKGDLSEKTSLPCCNCLACSAYCPSGLFPSFLYHTAVRGNQDDTLDINLHGCIRCGICNLVCPANLPLYETIIQTIEEYREA